MALDRMISFFITHFFWQGVHFYASVSGMGSKVGFQLRDKNEDTPVAFNHQKKFSFLYRVPRLNGSGVQLGR
jgi:hypothetical protein